MFALQGFSIEGLFYLQRLIILLSYFSLRAYCLHRCFTAFTESFSDYKVKVHGGCDPPRIFIQIWYVYTLKCSDETYYNGCTNNLEDRMSRYNKGPVHYTTDKLANELITYIAFSNKSKTYSFEKYLKSGSGISF